MAAYDKRFTKRLIGILIISVYSEYRCEGEYKNFIELYLFKKTPRLELFSLTYKTGTPYPGFYTYLGKFVADAMEVNEVRTDT